MMKILQAIMDMLCYLLIPSNPIFTCEHCYFPFPNQKLNSVFVSYASVDENLPKSEQLSLTRTLLKTAEDSILEKEFPVRENTLHFEGESKDLDLRDDFILIPAGASDLDFEAAKRFTAYKKVG